MEKTKKDIAAIDVPAKDVVIVSQYDRLIESGFNSNADLERMERLFELKKLHEENEARKEYFKAMAEFKKDPPLIKKDKVVSYQNSDGSWTSYNHADLGRSLNIISKALAPHGLSVNFKQQQGDGGLTITCILSHRLGYSESTSLFSSPDKSGGKNGIQGIGSADSYLRRYTLFSITGLAAEGEDDDGHSSEPTGNELITESQEADLVAMIEEKKVDLPKFLKHFNISKLSELWAATYPSAVQLVEAKK